METTEVEVVEMPMELAVFDPVANAVAKAKQKCANTILLYDTPLEIKDAKSFIYQLRQLKAPIAEIHKTAKAEALKFTKALDAKKKELTGAVEDMIEEKYAPLREIKEREDAKKAEEELKLEQEKEAEAEQTRLELEAREKALADERAKLEAEKAELESKENEAHIAAEATKKEAERQTKALVDAENKRIADVQREKDKAAAEAAKKEADLAYEKRMDEEAAGLLKSQEEERQANVEHRRKINKEVYDALWTAVGDPAAKKAFTALYEKKIPHCRIQY